MKIGILTFHDGINYGAFLQAFCLGQFVKELGHQVEYINYKSEMHQRNERQILIGGKNPFRILPNLIKIAKFHQLHRRFALQERLSDPGHINTTEYDVVILGADEIWNYGNRVFGRDLTYFGRFSRSGATRVVAYAPSAGNFNGETFPDEVRSSIKENLTSISVRDYRTADLIENAVGVRPTLVVDPIFLPIKIALPVVEVGQDGYLLLYAASLDSTYVEALMAVAKMRGVKVFAVGYRYSGVDRNFSTAGVSEFMGLIRGAICVVTTMFHGVMFAVKFSRGVCIIDNPYRRNKLAYAIDIFNLKGSIVYDVDGLRRHISKVGENQSRPYSDVSVEVSRDWLRNTVEDL